MQRKNRQVRRWRQCFWDTEFTRELLAKEFDEAIPLAQLKEELELEAKEKPHAN